jgi:hypothetical protein
MKGSSIVMERQSPVHLPGNPGKTKLRDHWPVVLEYADEGPGPWIVDLSHCHRWDIQGRDLAAEAVPGISLPDAPGAVTLPGKMLTGRTGQRQAFLWVFADKAAAPAGECWTEVTEGTFCLALLGRNVFQITEKLTSLDLGDPKRNAPYLLLGPFSHVTGQMVVLSKDPRNAVVLVAGTRGFAHDMVHAVLAAGEEFGLRPAGESRFLEKFKSLPRPDVPEKTRSAARKTAASDKPKSSGRTRSKIRIGPK